MTTKKIVKTFAGDYLDTIFITDQDTTEFQYGLEPVDGKFWDLTIASIDDKNKRHEYVLTGSIEDLRILANLIHNTLDAGLKK